jgi:hypothetical protein
VLRHPRFAGSHALQDAIGMPIASAEAALHDLNGDVVLNLSLASLDARSRYTYAELVASGLRDAIQRAIDAPPQLPEGFSPLEVAFSPGRADLTESGERQLAALADLLEYRTGLIAVLGTAISRADQRWFAEQALTAELGERSGFFDVLRVIGIQGARDRIHEALSERAIGEPGLLDEDDEELLDELIAEAPPVRPDRLVALGDWRLARVRDHLLDYHRIPRERVVSGRSERHQGFGGPTVDVELRVGARFDTDRSVP